MVITRCSMIIVIMVIMVFLEGLSQSGPIIIILVLSTFFQMDPDVIQMADYKSNPDVE